MDGSTVLSMIVGGLITLVVTILVSRWYYKKASAELTSHVEHLVAEGVATQRQVNAVGLALEKTLGTRFARDSDGRITGVPEERTVPASAAISVTPPHQADDRS